MYDRFAPRWRFIAMTTLLIAVAGLAACGATSQTGANLGTLTGDVAAGPTCPVERAASPCPDRPVPDRTVMILAADGHAAATVKTDAQGHFSAEVAPGTYTVQVAIVPGSVGMRQVTTDKVTVVAGQVSNIKVELDTGIR